MEVAAYIYTVYIERESDHKRRVMYMMRFDPSRTQMQ